MSTQHTPGPWVARPDPNAWSTDDWCVGIGDSLANIDKVAVCRERDARLIAAAPDLLEAAIRLSNRGWFKPVSCADEATLADMAMMSAAIAKATGDQL